MAVTISRQGRMEHQCRGTYQTTTSDKKRKIQPIEPFALGRGGAQHNFNYYNNNTSRIMREPPAYDVARAQCFRSRSVLQAVIVMHYLCYRGFDPSATPGA